jgi:hypothetical protein
MIKPYFWDKITAYVAETQLTTAREAEMVSEVGFQPTPSLEEVIETSIK